MSDVQCVGSLQQRAVPKQGRHSNQSNPAQDVPNRVPNEDPRNDVTKSVRNSELLTFCDEDSRSFRTKVRGAQIGSREGEEPERRRDELADQGEEPLAVGIRRKMVCRLRD